MSFLKKIIPLIKKELTPEFIRQKWCIKKFKVDELNNPGNYYSLNAFDYYGCIYIHVPKAAGISVSKSLFGNYAGGHKSYKDYQKIYPKKTLRNYFIFTFVRNPYSRLYSAFLFLKGGGINKTDQNFNDNVLSRYKTFEQFVMVYLNEETIFSYTHFIPQYTYLINKENNLSSINFIGKFENLQADFKFVSQTIKKNTALFHFNKTPNKHNDNYQMNNIVKEKIYLLYQKDFALFNYNK